MWRYIAVWFCFCFVFFKGWILASEELPQGDTLYVAKARKASRVRLATVQVNGQLKLVCEATAWSHGNVVKPREGTCFTNSGPAKPQPRHRSRVFALNLRKSPC